MVQSLLFIWHSVYSNMRLVRVHTVHRMIIEPTLIITEVYSVFTFKNLGI